MRHVARDTTNCQYFNYRRELHIKLFVLNLVLSKERLGRASGRVRTKQCFEDARLKGADPYFKYCA